MNYFMSAKVLNSFDCQADKGSYLDDLSSLGRKLYLNFKRQAKQMYYICTVPIRIVGYESAGNSAMQTTSKFISNYVKTFHILCPIHILYSKQAIFDMNFERGI